MRLMVVSNRVTMPERGEKVAAGGLAVALRSALEAHGGLWFGWSGSTSAEPSSRVEPVRVGKVSYAIADLTEAERRVARYLVNGFTSKEIAGALGCSPRTVEVHRANMIRKLKVRNSFELVSHLLAAPGR